MQKLNVKPATIFALIRENVAFVGRSSSVRLSAVCHSHCRGEHLSTQGHFDLEANRPELIILERLSAPSPVVYRHQLAWIYRLSQEGYQMLGSAETLERARELHPYSRSIYDQICAEPLAAVLERGRCARFSDGDIVPDEEAPVVSEQPERATERLSLRLTATEKDRYDRYAEMLGLTRRDALQYLVTQDRSLRHMDLDTELLEVKRVHGQAREKLANQVEKLKEDLSDARRSKGSIQRRHTGERRLVQTALRAFLDHFAPTGQIPLKIEQGYYRDYMQASQTAFAYPAGEGWAVVRPMAVLLGRGNAHFVVGTTGQGEEIMLRYYPDCYLGISPASELFGLRGSHWLMAWSHGEEDVAELLLSLPLDIKHQGKRQV